MSQPYFYIIRHIPTGKQYAGCKFAKDADPKKFMTIDGYKTSSKNILKIIKNEGLESFEIVDMILEDEIKIPFGFESVYEYETFFLREKNVMMDDMWFNQHNNRDFVHNTRLPKCKAQMIETARVNRIKNIEADPLYNHKRAMKVVESKRKNGTLNVKRPNQPEQTNAGRYVRTPEMIEKLKKSKLGKGMGIANAMNDPNKRKKVGESKLGRKLAINSENGQRKYVYPNNIPEGYILK
jgi:hypothetical protein